MLCQTFQGACISVLIKDQRWCWIQVFLSCMTYSDGLKACHTVPQCPPSLHMTYWPEKTKTKTKPPRTWTRRIACLAFESCCHFNVVWFYHNYLNILFYIFVIKWKWSDFVMSSAIKKNLNYNHLHLCKLLIT